MKNYTVVVRLAGALADAVALEWTSHAAPLDSGEGWEPCLRRADGAWRFSSRAAPGATPAHLRRPGAFGDIAVRYRLNPAGSWSAPSPSRKELVIVEVIDDDDVLIPPTLVRAPGLTGAALIGAELGVDPGLWTGFPTPDLAFQWRRDGTDIPGAVARAYAPAPADDRCALTCAVTARSLAGETAAISAALRATYPAPVALGDLPEEVFDEGVEPELVDASTAFAGADLSFAAVGAPIDRRTGVVAVPTHTPVSGATVTITATNSGGAATVRLPYTVEAAPVVTPRPLGAADVTLLRSVWRPAGQTATFSPLVAFPGLARETVDAVQWTAAARFDLETNWHPCVPLGRDEFELRASNHPVPAGQVDPAVWRRTPVERLSQLRVRWRQAADGPWSPASEALTVAEPAPVVVGRLPAPTAAMFAECLALSALRYNMAEHGEGSGGTNRAKTVHSVMVCALGALAGTTTTYGGKTPSQHLTEQLIHWTQGATAPAARGGVFMQSDLGAVCAIAIARLTPSVWDALTQVQRTRLDLIMKGCLVACCWQNSDTNPWVVAGRGADERRIDGGQYGRNRVINFTTPSALTPLIVAAYMGGATPGANATAFLNGFNRAAFAAEIAAAGALEDMWDTFRQTNSTDGRSGPDAATLQNAVRNYRFLGKGLTSAADVASVAIGEIDQMWSRTIKQGLTLSASSPIPLGSEYRAGQYGIFEKTSQAGARNVGRGALVGRIFDLDDWAHWEAAGIAGRIGMAAELDAQDGGLPGSPSGAGPRSAMTYAHDGARVTLMGTLTLIAQGQLARTDAALQAAFERQGRGVKDLQLRTQYGHRSFAKGGRLWGNGTNEDWIAGLSLVETYRLESLHGLWLSVGAPWAAGG